MVSTTKETKKACTRYRFEFCAVLGQILFGTIANVATVYQLSSLSKESNRTHENSNSYPSHCIIHVHGMHHTGTGFLRETVFQALGGSLASQQSVPETIVAPQGEGQHLQTVYPVFKQRNKELCRLPTNHSGNTSLPQVDYVAQEYYCPNLMNHVLHTFNTTTTTTTRVIGEQLFAEWARYWDMRKPYLIQKTPTFDVLFLEQALSKLTPSVHVLVVGHPMKDVMNWIDVWAVVLDQLATAAAANDDAVTFPFAVVKFETLVLEQDSVQKELATLIRRDCGVLSPPNNIPSYDTTNQTAKTLNPSARRLHQPSHRHRRRLEFHGGEPSDTYLSPKQSDLKGLELCRRKKQCKEAMDELQHMLLEYFGYTWGPTSFFENATHPSKLLFSSRSPPPQELVDKFMSLRETYSTSARQTIQ